MGTRGDSLNTIPGQLATTKIEATGTPGALTVLRGDGVWATGYHRSLSITYISGTGTAGTDNTAETLKTLVLPANTMTQVGDRLFIEAAWKGTTGSAITGTLKLNGVSISHSTDTAGATSQFNESLLSYIDSTHANVVEEEGSTHHDLTVMNSAGFNWTANQNITFSQDAALNNHILLYELIVDFMPAGS